METLRAAARKQTTETILQCVIAMGGGFLATSEERMVRAALIDVYVERASEEEGDALMEMIGM